LWRNPEALKNPPAVWNQGLIQKSKFDLFSRSPTRSSFETVLALVHAVAGAHAIAGVSYLLLALLFLATMIMPCMVHDVGGIYAVASVSSDAGVSGVAGPTVTGIRALSLSMLLLAVASVSAVVGTIVAVIDAS
jgi:hypothetical protein